MRKFGPFTIELASVRDREALVAEVWLGDEQFAEVAWNDGTASVEVYPSPGGAPRTFPLDALVEALEWVKKELGGTHAANPQGVS